MEKKSRYGKIFYSCNRYPKCKYALWDPPVAEPCPKCGWPLLVDKTTKRDGHGAQMPAGEVRLQGGAGAAGEEGRRPESQGRRLRRRSPPPRPRNSMTEAPPLFHEGLPILPMSAIDITVIGGGLAGCEAAWQAAAEGARVRLFEMKPQRFSPAHHSAAARRTGLLQLPARRRDEQRRRVPEGGAAPLRRPVHGRRRRHRRPCRRSPGRRPRRLRRLADPADRRTSADRAGARGGDGNSRRRNRHPRLGSPYLGGPLDRHRPAHRRRAALLLRCHRAHRRGRLHRLRQGLAGIALRQGGG